MRLVAVIPSHNRPELLRRAVRSILAQTVLPSEIIVVDEGSEPAIDLSDIANPVPIRVLRNEVPQGPGRARNQGAEAARAEVVAFLDDDDAWLPAKVERVLSAFEAHPGAGAVAHFGGPSFERRTGAVRRVDDALKKILTYTCPWHPSTMSVRRDVHQRIRFDETLPAAEDLDYAIRLVELTSFVEIDEALTAQDDAHLFDSAISLERRIAGKKMLRQKHSRYFEDEAVEHCHRFRMGQLYWRSAQRSPAAAWFLSAAAVRPRDARAWRGLARCLIPGELVRWWLARRRLRKSSRWNGALET